MPALTLASLRTQIQARKLAPVYLFFGDDVRLMEQMVDAIEATIDPADRPFAVERMYAGEDGGSPLDVAAVGERLPDAGRSPDRHCDARGALSEAEARRQGRGAPRPRRSTAEAEDDARARALDTVPLEAYVDNPSPTTVAGVRARPASTRRGG